MAIKRKLDSTSASATASEPAKKQQQKPEPAVEPPPPQTEEAAAAEDEEPDEEEEEEEEEEEVEEEYEEEEEVEEEETLTAPPSADPAPSNAANGGDKYGDLDEPIEALLEPFSKDQIVNLLKDAAERHRDVAEKIRRVADEDPIHRKIFVHGLGWDTTAETLTSVFAKYGEIEDCKAVLDKASGKSKGYGFILFKSRSGSRRALKQPQKKRSRKARWGWTRRRGGRKGSACLSTRQPRVSSGLWRSPISSRAIDGPKPVKGHYGILHHHNNRNKNPGGFGGLAAAGPAHLMVPGTGIGFNPGAASSQALNPALGQALALLAMQGAGLNLFGGLGAQGVNPGGAHVMPGGYGSQPSIGTYGNQATLPGGYPNPQLGQGGTGRGSHCYGQYGGPPYTGR